MDFFIVRDPESDDALVRINGTASTSLVGGFTGKSGGIRRTRKGRTRRLANGRRDYLPGPGEPTVVAYMAKSIVR